MRPNLQSLKLVIRLLILLILLVMLFIISSFLYSAKYWPDVYNYINANITIKRIPTISELHPVVVYEIDYTTELYSTTDSSDYLEGTTDIDDLNLSFEDFMNGEYKRRKRQIPIEEMKINIETIKANYDYIFDIEVTTKSYIHDLVNVDKLTMSDPKYFEMIAKTDDCVKEVDDHQSNTGDGNIKPDDGIDSVYPWIAALFVMNSESNQFEYVCDGGLVSERVVLTAANCVVRSNMTADMANVLVILGKRSLQSMGPNERVLRVKSIKIHENFTSAEQVDLAVIVLAESVPTNVDIRPAPLGVENKSDPLAIATTGWHVTGPLQPLYLGPQTAESCIEKTGFKNTICAVLGNNETTCPSFGGLLVDRQDDNQWRLMGIATGIPTTNGVCFNKDLVFTRILNHLEWISKNVQGA